MATEAQAAAPTATATPPAPPPDAAKPSAPDPKEAKAPADDKQKVSVDEAMERIADKERAHRKEREKLEAERKEIDQYKSDIDTLRSIRGKRDFLAAAKLAGYDDPKEAIRDGALKLAGDQKPKTVEDKLADFERRWAERDKQEAEARKKSEEESEKAKVREHEERIVAARTTHRQKMGEWLAAHEAEYPELAGEDNAGRAISDAIWDHWNKTFDKDTSEGEQLPTEKAAAILESYLVKKAERKAAIREKYKKAPEAKKEVAAEPAKPTGGTTAVESAGEEKGPEPKQSQGGPLNFDSMSMEELLKVNPDTLSDQDRIRLSVALLK